MKSPSSFAPITVGALALLALAWSALAQTPTAAQKSLREIYQELVEINTTDSAGDTTKAAEAMAVRLKAGGIPADDIKVIVPPGAPRKGNLVARLRGTGTSKPILLLAHIDVVEAKREDWERDPFKLLEEDGYFYARGSIDDKAMAAIFVANLVRYKREGYRPERDVILALTTDEELGSTSKWNGVRWLLANHRELIDAEFGINEGGGGHLKNGKPLLNQVQAAEKVPVNFRLEVKNPGGHSARPRKDNAIYELAEGLTRLGRYEFPAKLGEITRGYFARSAQLESGQLADDMRAVVRDIPDPRAVTRLSVSPLFNATLRTTCVATRLEGGHATNALPQTARATVNCRILPGEAVDDVQRAIVTALANPNITVTRISEPQLSSPSPLRPDLMQAVDKLTHQFWPGIPVVPVMGVGATDSRFLRNAGIPCYGVSGLFTDPSDNRTHGLNERILVKSLYEGHEFLYLLVKALSSSNRAP